MQAPLRKRRKPVPFKVDGLSVTGRELVDAMLREGCTYEAIIKALRSKTNEVVGLSSLWRYRNKKFIEPETKVEAVNKVHQMLAGMEILLIEIRDALRALGARQLRVAGGQYPAKTRAVQEGESGSRNGGGW
jgi:hypothetical protein